MLEADNLARLFPEASFHWGGIHLGAVHSLGIIVTLIILPTCYLRDFRKISFISGKLSSNLYPKKTLKIFQPKMVTAHIIFLTDLQLVV